LTVKEMADLAKGRLKKKKDAICEALVGRITEHHVFMIRASLEHIRGVKKLVADVDRQIADKLKPYEQEVKLLETIPGVKEQGSASILAEIGADMEQFPSAEHLSSWAGMSPGNHESGGKKKRQRPHMGTKR
jgi:transposase